MVYDMSRNAGAVYDLQGAGSSSVASLREALATGFNPVWHYDIEVDVERAIGLLHANGAFAVQSE